MSFNDSLKEKIETLEDKIRKSEENLHQLTGEDCSCGCSKCLAAHDFYDEDDADEMRENIKSWKLELKNLKNYAKTIKIRNSLNLY